MTAAATRPLLADAEAEHLGARIADLGSVVVAFSGGVDSSLVAALAARALGDRALAVTAVSPALAAGELAGARGVAAAIGIAHETIATDELQRSGYRRNGRDRCYHCKSELYDALDALAAARGFQAVLSGANADDAGDWRPGLWAAAEHGVVHPLLEAGVGKARVRALAEALGVPSARKVASPCLASRIPYGTPVKPAALARIDAAELAVRALGYPELRVRHHGELGRVEIAGGDLTRAQRPDQRCAIERAVRSAGYPRAEVSDEPLRSGSLNDAAARGGSRTAARARIETSNQRKEKAMTAPYTLKKLTDVEDSAPKFGLEGVQEARFANDDLEVEHTGVSHHRLNTGKRQGFAHRHDNAEEVYVVLAGSGRLKLDDDIIEIERLDAIRVAPGVIRAFEAGSEGLEFLAFGRRHEGDGEVISDWWTD